MKAKKLTVPVMERADCGNQHLNGICVSGKARELLLEIRDLLNVFAPNGDDYRHSLWIEVPRGRPADWMSFRDVKMWNEDVRSRTDYLKEWKMNYPRMSQWYHLSVTRYKGHTFLHMVENDHWWCLLHDDDGKSADKIDMDWFMEPLVDYLREVIPQIAANVSNYNRYVEEHLPKRQRTGRISRRELDRIVPWQRRLPRGVKKAIRVLKECVANEDIYGRLSAGESVDYYPASYREPLPEMSIRLYARYFRIAYNAYENHFLHLYKRSRKEVRRIKEELKKAESLSDVEFYQCFQHGRHGEITDETDLDSVAEFTKMAFDHYGELGLSRLNLHATEHYTPGRWLFTFGISYSAWVDCGIEIAVALFDAGCPLIVHDAQRLLDILEEKDNVKLTPHTFHDYLGHHEEGSVFDLPYECYLGEGNEITMEQYEEIVSLATWVREEQIVLDVTVPLDDSVYDLVRESVSKPLTACEILWELEKKYNVIVGIINHENWHECYLYEHGGDDLRINLKDREFSSANEAMLCVMREFVNAKKSQKPDSGL
jgi:hypothetical protein